MLSYVRRRAWVLLITSLVGLPGCRSQQLPIAVHDQPLARATNLLPPSSARDTAPAPTSVTLRPGPANSSRLVRQPPQLKPPATRRLAASRLVTAAAKPTGQQPFAIRRPERPGVLPLRRLHDTIPWTIVFVPIGMFAGLFSLASLLTALVGAIAGAVGWPLVLLLVGLGLAVLAIVCLAIVR